MRNPLLKAIAQQRRLIAKLEGQVAAARRKELASLPEQYGFATLREFVQALRESSRLRARGRPRGKAKPPAPEAPPSEV